MGYEYDSLVVTVQEGRATIQLNRPECMNAFEHQLRADFLHCLDRLSGDDRVRVIVLTGSGKAFSAGGDLREIGEGMTLPKANAYMEEVSRVIMAVWDLKKPIIAAVNGVAYGAGFSIAMACDLIFASEESTFSLAFVKVGLAPDLGASYFLPRLIGLHRAKEWIFTGKILPARELMDLGLINDVVPSDRLKDHVSNMAASIALGPPLALTFAKGLLNQNWDRDFRKAVRSENKNQAICLASKDHREGVAAFYEKRAPRFTGK